MTTRIARRAAIVALALSAALGGAALSTAPASAKAWHGGFGHHGHGKHWGHGHWGHGGVRIVSYYGGGYDGCYVVRQKVFVPGFGFVRRPVKVCD